MPEPWPPQPMRARRGRSFGALESSAKGARAGVEDRGEQGARGGHAQKVAAVGRFDEHRRWLSIGKGMERVRSSLWRTVPAGWTCRRRINRAGAADKRRGRRR